MTTRKPIRPIKEEGVLVDKKATAARKRAEEKEMAGYYILIIAAYPFLRATFHLTRAYRFVKSFFTAP
jgi:hypothetical protein